MSLQSAELTSTDSPTAPDARLGVREQIARAIVRIAAGRVPVDILLPDGRRLAPLLGSLLGSRGGGSATPAGEPGRPRIVLHRPEIFYRRLADNPKVGLGEAYTAGDWSAAADTDLADALTPFADRVTTLLPGWLLRLRRLVDRPIPADKRGAQEDMQRNVAGHYDLSNDLFAAFLDPTMTYSAALFDRDRPRGEQSLAEAQRRKINAALDLCGVTAGTRVLEIGTGWGALAVEAARRGAWVTTVTLSIEQAGLARERIAGAGLDDRVTVLVQDYREITGTFDAIVSVEMIEAVGERYWPDFFATIRRLLEPGGAVALQSILMSHARYLSTRNSYSWIQKHIFFGGLIPSLTAIERHAADAGLRVTGHRAFGADYAETLRRWRASFLDAWPAIRSGRFDEDFRRAWEFYLAYSEAGFCAGYLDVAQIRLVPREAA